MNVGSLFTGIGGFDLGLERAGMRTVWQCEQNPYRRRVLAKHWPGVPCYDDVCALVADTTSGRERICESTRPFGKPDRVCADGRVPVRVPYVDVLCGGFPCQDLSVAGKGAGIEGSRSGLWREFARLIGELRPRYVIVENVPALLTRGGHRVLEDLAACGFDAEWDCLPASAFGAPHRRDRVWVVAYPQRDELRLQPAGLSGGGGPPEPGHDGPEGHVADAEVLPVGAGLREGEQGGFGRGRLGNGGGTRPLGDPDVPSEDAHAPESGPRPPIGERGWWGVEPNVGRVAHGIPNRVDRLAALGDSLVPQIAEWIGNRIMDFEQQRQRTEAAA